MATLKTFRHEFKYVISYDEMLRLKKKLEEVLMVDRDANGYMIRSLYFDSIDDTDYYEKLGGDLVRKKVRIRIYEPEPSLIKLELKAKNDIHQLKKSLIISRNDAERLIAGDYSVLLNYEDEVAREIYIIMQKDVYRPKAIVEYQRLAFLGGTTTRITFDFNVRYSNDFDNFFSSNLNCIDVIDKKDIILEVKFDRFLEPYLSDILSCYDSRCQSVSKYALGRNLGGI